MASPAPQPVPDSSQVLRLCPCVEALHPLERAAFQSLYEHFTRTWQPPGPESQRLVAQLALAHHRLNRLRAVQARHIQLQIQTLCEKERRPAPNTLDELTLLEARVRAEDAARLRLLDRYTRQEQALLRELRHLEESLKTIRAALARRSTLSATLELQNEPNWRIPSRPFAPGIRALPSENAGILRPPAVQSRP